MLCKHHHWAAQSCLVLFLFFPSVFQWWHPTRWPSGCSAQAQKNPPLFLCSFLVLLPCIVLWGSHTQFSFSIMCTCVSLYVQVPVEVVVSSHMWVLRTKLGSFARAVGALNYLRSLQPHLSFSLFFLWDRVSPCSSGCLELAMKSKFALNYSQSSLSSCRVQSKCLIITKDLGFACSMSLYLSSLALECVPWPSHKATSKRQFVSLHGGIDL